MSHFTKTPPIEPGWYWIDETVVVAGSRDSAGQPVAYTNRIILEVQQTDTGLHLCGIDTGDIDGPECFSVAEAIAGKDGHTFRFGPRIPSPEEIALLTWIREQVNAAVNVVGSRDEMDTILTEIQGKLQESAK